MKRRSLALVLILLMLPFGAAGNDQNPRALDQASDADLVAQCKSRLEAGVSPSQLEELHLAFVNAVSAPVPTRQHVELAERVLANEGLPRPVRDLALQKLVDWDSVSSIPVIEAQLEIQHIALQTRIISSLVKLDSQVSWPKIRPFLRHEHAELQKEALLAALHFEDATAVQEATRLLDSSNESVVLAAIDLLISFRATESLPSVRKLLTRKNRNVQVAAIKTLGLLKDSPSLETLRAMIPPSGIGRTSLDPVKAEALLTALVRLGDDSVLPAVLELSTKDIYETASIHVLANFPESVALPVLERKSRRRSLFGAAKLAKVVQHTRFDQLRYHPLYRSLSDKEFKNFSDPEAQYIKVKKFTKTGSSLFLLGGKLTGKVVVRAMRKGSVEVWRRLFEDKLKWQQLGYAEPPIEPITDIETLKTEFNLTADELTSVQDLMNSIQSGPLGYIPVLARVLGPTLNSYSIFGDLFATAALIREKRRLIRILRREFKVDHGHPHMDNFCVTTGPDGLRLYLIDFDQSAPIAM